MDQCTSRAEITLNTMVGAPQLLDQQGRPSTAQSLTDGMELYERNMVIADNRISGFALDGIAVHSAANVVIERNWILDNNWAYPFGGIAIGNTDPNGRRLSDVTVQWNIVSNTTPARDQKYGLRLDRVAGVPLARNVTISNNDFRYQLGHAWGEACYSEGYSPFQGFPQSPQGVLAPPSNAISWVPCLNQQSVSAAARGFSAPVARPSTVLRPAAKLPLRL